MGSNQTCFNFLFLEDQEADVREKLPQTDAPRLEGLVTEGRMVSVFNGSFTSGSAIWFNWCPWKLVEIMNTTYFFGIILKCQFCLVQRSNSPEEH